MTTTPFAVPAETGTEDALERLLGAAPADAPDTAGLWAAWIDSPVGPLAAAATRDGICLLEFLEPDRFESQLHTLRRHFPSGIARGEHAHVARLREELGEYFAGRRTAFGVPLVYPGTPFQRRVWDELLRIPHGETRSYEDLAVRLGARGAVRAVGRANGANRIAIVIPCHRVVNKNGRLGGYGGGLWRKDWLLALERPRGLHGRLFDGAPRATGELPPARERSPHAR